MSRTICCGLRESPLAASAEQPIEFAKKTMIGERFCLSVYGGTGGARTLGYEELPFEISANVAAKDVAKRTEEVGNRHTDLVPILRRSGILVSV